MTDEALIIRVARGGDEIGEFYLSFVELSLKNGNFQHDDWGWIEGMIDWRPLGEVTSEARESQGKKRRITSGQRDYLKKCGFVPWRGMSNREASRVIDSLIKSYNILPGEWIDQPITNAQVQLLHKIGVEFDSSWTKGQASKVISERLNAIENENYNKE